MRFVEVRVWGTTTARSDWPAFSRHQGLSKSQPTLRSEKVTMFSLEEDYWMEDHWMEDDWIAHQESGKGADIHRTVFSCVPAVLRTPARRLLTPQNTCTIPIGSLRPPSLFSLASSGALHRKISRFEILASSSEPCQPPSYLFRGFQAT